MKIDYHKLSREGMKDIDISEEYFRNKNFKNENYQKMKGNPTRKTESNKLELGVN